MLPPADYHYMLFCDKINRSSSNVLCRTYHYMLFCDKLNRSSSILLCRTSLAFVKEEAHREMKQEELHVTRVDHGDGRPTSSQAIHPHVLLTL